MSELETVVKELKGLPDALKSAEDKMILLVKKQEDDLKKHGVTTSETAALMTKQEQVLNRLASDVGGQLKRLEELEITVKRASLGGFGNPDDQPMTVGEAFIQSEEFKGANKRRAGKTDWLEIKAGLFDPRGRPIMLRKDLTGAEASVGRLVDGQFINRIYEDPARRPERMHIRPLVGSGQTNSDSIRYPVQRGGFTNNAAPQWNTDLDPARPDLGTKPESNLVITLETIPVQTLAHWIPASNQVMDDAPMLRGYVDGLLLYGLRLIEDIDILYGDGTDGHLLGITQTPNVHNVGGVGSLQPAGAVVADTVIDHIRRAIAVVSVDHYAANGVIVHPTDWATIELTKGTDGHYIWVTVTMGGEQRLWRVPVVDTTAVQVGEFVLGDWQIGATLWDRQQSRIRVADQHADFFIKNAVVILAEERLALGVHNPKAFAFGTFDPATT